MTPRTVALYASNERQYTPAATNTNNSAQMSKAYANMPVHRLVSNLSQGGSRKMTNFVKLASGPKEMQQNESGSGAGAKLAPPQPVLFDQKRVQSATNLGQMKAPTIITERPAKEESDQPEETHKTGADLYKLERHVSFIGQSSPKNSIAA